MAPFMLGMLTTIQILNIFPVWADVDQSIKSPLPVIAVIDFEALNVTSIKSLIVADLIEDALVQSGGFVVVERRSIQGILREQFFQRSGCTTYECAIEIEKLFNAQFVVMGNIDKYENQYRIRV